MSGDSLQRHALHDRLDERHGWSVETVEALFRVMRDASPQSHDIDMVDHALLAQLVDGAESYPNQAADVTRLHDLIAKTRLLLMPVVIQQDWVGLLAYSAEWKHWFVCGSRSRDFYLARVNHIQSRLSQLDIVPAHNHTRQFYAVTAVTQSDTAEAGLSGLYASFYAYVMLRNIRHFPYCDEFSVCLSQELAVLDERNRSAFVHHLRASLLPSQ